MSEDATRARLMNIYDPYGFYQGTQNTGGTYVDWTKGQYIVNDPLSLNLYTYCQDNPVRYRDSSGNMAAEAAVAATNWWNPIGWIAAGVLVVEVVVAGVLIYKSVQNENHKALNSAYSLMAYASTTAAPPPPNDPNSKGTQTTSKTLYNKNGTHIDVENPGNRVGQIHAQQGNSKYIYDVAGQCFKTTSGELAPKSVQNLLTDPKVVKAIAKGLVCLGY